MPVPEIRPGDVLHDTYLVSRLISKGGMGQVYEVEHSRLSGRYALKLLRPELADNPEVLDRFRREAEIASALRHPHIIQVFDFNVTAAGAPYMVMEYLDGLDLKAYLRTHGPLPLARAVKLVEQVASALRAAHEREVVHRDLKPENIFLVEVEGTGQGQKDFAKVLDFG